VIFSLYIKLGDRITLEADTRKDAHALYDLLDETGKALPLNFYNVTQVEIAVAVRIAPNKPPKQESFRITYPTSCSLKYDDLDLRLREMLALSGIEPMALEKTVSDERETPAL